MDQNQNGRWEFDSEGNAHYIPPQGGSASSGSTSSGSSARRSNSPKKSNDNGWHWILIILAFIVAWPIGLILLIAELSGKWKDSAQVQKEVSRATSAAKSVAKDFSERYKENQDKARTTQASHNSRQPAKQEKKQTRKQKAEKDNGKAYGLGGSGAFRGWGIALMAIFGFSSVMTLIDEITYFYSMGWLLESVLPLVAFFLIGLTLFMVGTKRKGKLKKFKKYLTMIGKKDSVFIPSLAKAMGTSEKKATEDLEEMLERGFFDCGYVDAARQCLVLSEGFEEPPAPEPEQPKEEATPESVADATMRRIRSINDAIANPERSEKIDRIEVLTGKILKLLEERPEKAGELRSFMNYYLPQTLKILENYSKLEAQGIEGGNIAEAKQKIEGMMDKVVDGYETQLDKLFADDVLDISADLKVMESMLEKDGLAMENELRF